MEIIIERIIMAMQAYAAAEFIVNKKSRSNPRASTTLAPNSIASKPTSTGFCSVNLELVMQKKIKINFNLDNKFGCSILEQKHLSKR